MEDFDLKKFAFGFMALVICFIISAAIFGYDTCTLSVMVGFFGYMGFLKAYDKWG